MNMYMYVGLIEIKPLLESTWWMRSTEMFLLHTSTYCICSDSNLDKKDEMNYMFENMKST